MSFIYIALDELHRVSREYVVISIPEGRDFCELIFRMPMLWHIFKRCGFRIVCRFPAFLKNNTTLYEGHYWEMGVKGATKKELKKKIYRNFDILEERTPSLNPYHYFFVLKKKM